MLGRLNHVAIAVPNVRAAAEIYRSTFAMGAAVSEPVAQPEHGVTTVFVDLGNTKIELVEPLGHDSPITKFLTKHPKGGIHHVCYEVTDIEAARDRMLAKGATITGDGLPKIGAHGKPVIFMHPRDFNGTLIELEQV